MRQIILYVILLLFISLAGKAQEKLALGRAESYTVLAGTGVNNSGDTKIDGNLGVSPGTISTGFPPGLVSGQKDINVSAATDAQTDLTLAYNQAQKQSPTSNLSGLNLGGRTLTPGVYKFDGNAALSGNLILDNGGNPDAVFIFQIGGNFTVSNGATINFSNAAPPRVINIFWQVAGSTSIGDNSVIKGSILCNQNITVGTGALVQGRLLSRNGMVRLTNNTITIPTDLEITQTVSPGVSKAEIYSIGDQVTFTLTARNLGPAADSQVKITNRLGAGLDFVSSSVSGSVYDAATGIRTWTLPAFPEGTVQTIEIVARINENAPILIESRATIAGDKVDEILSNNTKTVDICVMPVNPGVISGPSAVCARGTRYTFSVAPIAGALSYNWSLPEGWTFTSERNSPAIEVTAGTEPGEITVTVNNTCGVTLPSSKSITVSTAPSPAPGPITPSNKTNNPCVGDRTITYSIEPVLGATSYRWEKPSDWVITDGQGTTSITVTVGQVAGDIKVVAVNGCGDSDPGVLPVAPSAARPDEPVAINGSANPCINESNSYSVNPVPGATSYRWTVPANLEILTGQGTPAITVKPLNNASATITLVAVNGCGETTVAFAVNPITKVKPGSISGPGNPCINTSNTYSIAPVPGATTYFWTVPGLSNVPGQGTTAITFSPVGSMTITVSALFACGFSSPASFNITPVNKPAQPAPITSSKQQVCAGHEVTFFIPAVTGATRYAWEVPNGWRITAGANTTAITVAAGAAAGNVTVTASNNCGSTAATLAVAAPATGAPEAIGAITGNNSVCAGNTATLTYYVATVNNAAEYIWTVPTGWEILSGQGTAAITVKSNNNTGAISVLAKNGCGIGASSTLPVEVTSRLPLTPGNITGNTKVCAATNEITYSIGAVSGATGYAWEVPTGWEIMAGQGTTSIKVITGSTSGNISVKAVNGCGNSAEASVLAVAITAVPETPVAITGEKDQCAGNSGKVYNIEGVKGATSYTWTVPADWVITAGQGTNAITITAGSESGNVRVVAGNTCGDSQAQLMAVSSVGIPSSAPAKIFASDNLICSEQTGLTYSIDPVPTATAYAWILPEGWTITEGQGTTSITVTAGTKAGNIEVKALNGCGESGAQLLPVDPTATAATVIGTITGETTACSGQAGLVYAVPEVPGATNYTWTVPQDWTITAGQGSNTVTVTIGKTSGEIAVTAANTCTTSLPSTLAVQVNLSPQALSLIKEESNPCAGLAYAVPGVDGATAYIWTVPAGWEIVAGQGTTAIKVTAPDGSPKGLVSVVAQTPTCNTAPVSIEANPARADVDLTIANVFSPNGDGVNDKWEIVNIQNYAENDLVIINRWGSEVYRSKSYHNQWDGGELSAGTYFYVLKVKVCDGSYKTHKGYVMIMK